MRFVFAPCALLFLLSCSATAPKPKTSESTPISTTPRVEIDPERVAISEEPLSPESVLLAEAEGYYTVAVAAHQRDDFDEAEYNFEKALELLADLDPQTEFTMAESDNITALLDRIGDDYQHTIRARGDHLSSPEMSAFMMRFEDLESLRNWQAYSDMQRALEPDSVVYDIPVVWNERVKNCIFYFQTIARSNMEVYLKRSGQYLPMMQEIFKSYGLPLDLCYLPIIESGFNPRAYSYAKASGPWQFIPSTGVNYGLDRDWWRDERRDFVRSTHSAARYLKVLYGMFDHWYLALAAYNGGEGRVSRTIRKQKTRDFWSMRLRKQTENYVPLYLASLVIAKDPERFGFYVEPLPPLQWDEVTIDKPIELSVVARHIGCSTDQLKDLNPELLRGVTPPSTKGYVLRIPVGLEATFAAAYEKIPQSERTEWVKYTIRKGETLSGIARRHGVSVQAVKDANKLRSSRIIAGRQLVIPVPMGSGSRGSSRHVVASSTGEYRVRPGDTMWDIARAHGTSVEWLSRTNNISSRRKIYPGQLLKVPGDQRGTTTAGRRASGKATYSEYRVRAGDSLWDIANRHGTSVSTLAGLNNISSRGRIYPGQTLRVPSSSGSSSGKPFTYVVRRGDNLSRIASRFGIGVREIIEFNNIVNPERIAVGMRLVIPSGS